MDLQHMTFCQPGSRFYDRLGDEAVAAGEYPLSSGPVPEGWQRETNAEWAHLSPADLAIRPQGWKVHVSATLGNAEEVLRISQEHCLAQRLNFKFIRSRTILVQRNSKYGDRSVSGKFITIYPSGDDELRQVLEQLGSRLEGREGPYILSDLRWRDGPLYVRYGGFVARMTAGADGRMVPGIEDPEGRLVPDVRGFAFRPPPWAPLPDFLEEAVAARARGTMQDFPFRVTSALHFSNGGGVYRGTDTRTGADVLLKEGRPHAGIDEVGRDAVARLETERRILERLDGIGAVPRLIDYRKGSEHMFLVREYVEGKALQRVVASRNPLLNGRTGRDELRAYTAWAMRVLDDVDAAVDELHARGIVYADLHPGNILITPDDEIRFVDFETSDDIDAHEGQTIGAPGFRAPAHYRGVAVDRYAMGCLCLSIFVPLTTMLPWDPAKVDDLVALVVDEFPVPDDFGDRVRADLAGRVVNGRPVAVAPVSRAWVPPTAVDWPATRDRIVRGILDSATPERDDRLYPGDVGQFLVAHGGLSLAYGAAGVIAALVDAGVQVPAEHLDWLAAHALAAQAPAPGLFDGLAGIAYALDRAGRGDDARRCLAIAQEATGSADDKLLSGSAGVGLALACSAQRTGSREQLDAAVAIAAELADGTPDSGDRVGVLRGSSGHALLYLALHRALGDPALLDRAAAAIRRDLRQMGWQLGARPDSAEWNVGLLQTGSGGVGLALEQLLAERPDDELFAARAAICDIVSQRYAPQAGLWLGRAGLLLACHELAGADRDAEVDMHLRGLGWYALPLDGTVMFFGDGLLRLSCDLASGSAGVLAVVDRVLGTADRPLPMHLFGTA